MTPLKDNINIFVNKRMCRGVKLSRSELLTASIVLDKLGFPSSPPRSWETVQIMCSLHVTIVQPFPITIPQATVQSAGENVTLMATPHKRLISYTNFYKLFKCHCTIDIYLAWGFDIILLNNDTIGSSDRYTTIWISKAAHCAPSYTQIYMKRSRFWKYLSI